jgi:hypothetical protein
MRTVKFFFINSIFVFSLLQPSLGQVIAQTDSAFGYFPLNTGDLHQFNFHFVYWYSASCESSAAHFSYHVEQIANDTLMPNGHIYKRILSTMPYDPPESYLRVDSMTANVYRYSTDTTPAEFLVDSLRATPGSSFMHGSNYQVICSSYDTISIFGIQTIAKKFVIPMMPPVYYSLTYGIGRTQFIQVEDGWCVFNNPEFLDLNYARINNKEYGSFVSVGNLNNVDQNYFSLKQNYPNPFNPTTTIEVTIPKSCNVNLKIVNTLGQDIATLMSGDLHAGTYSFNWNANSSSSGVYYYRLKAGSYMETKKLLLLK